LSHSPPNIFCCFKVPKASPAQVLSPFNLAPDLSSKQSQARKHKCWKESAPHYLMSTTRKATDEKEEEEAQARQATAPQNLLNCRQSKASKQSPETLTMHGSLTFPEEEVEEEEVLVINNKNKNTP
jgi:hypothetical protein